MCYFNHYAMHISSKLFSVFLLCSNGGISLWMRIKSLYKISWERCFFSSHSYLEVGDLTVSSILVSSCICELTVKEVCFWKRKHYVIAKKQGSLMERAVPVNSAETPWVLRERCRILVRTYWPDNGPKTNKAVIKSKIWMEKNYREFRRISVRVRHLF